MMSDEQIAHLGRRSTEFSVGEQVPGTPYLVVSQIGQGGMGSVYEVEHRELGKRFVLKALLDQFCQREDLVQRLRNEWRSLGRLEHPNIVSVSDAGMATNGAPFYVMERLQGESLANALGRLGRLTLLDSMRLAAEVLEGLAAAHEIGIVHRDVKPPNIFITQTGAAKLLDFGIAKLTDGASLELTGRGIAIGTPRYMSPEQAAGEKVDGRADLYAVGLVLFEMLCGNGPFDGCESHEVFLAHITRQPPRLSDLLEGIPPELDGLVAGLLAKRPYERPQSAGTAAAALRSMLRTYRSLEQAPDTRAEELDGVLTPLVQGEFVQALAQGQNPRAGLAAFPVSGNGPTASVSQVPQLFARHGASPSFPTPPFNVRSATPPFDARGSTPPFEARSTPSGYERGPSATPATDSLGHPSSRGWSVAPATRTAHPEAGLGRTEATPSGVSRSTSPGDLLVLPLAVSPARRKFPLWAAVGGAFTAALIGGWLVGEPPRGQETELSAQDLAANAPLAEAERPSNPSAATSVVIPKPAGTEGVSAPPRSIAPVAGPALAASPLSVTTFEQDSPAGKAKTAKAKRAREVEAHEAVEAPPESPPVARPSTEREPASVMPPEPKVQSPSSGSSLDKPGGASSRKPRLPTSGIGGI